MVLSTQLSVNVSHHLSVNVTFGSSPTSCPQHHLCAPAPATPIAAHLPWSRSLTRKRTITITYTVPLSPATAQSTSPATQHHTPRLRPVFHLTHLPLTLPNSQCTTHAHQPHLLSSPRHQHQLPRCLLSRPRRNSRTRTPTLTRLRLSSLPSPRHGNTTTTSRLLPQPRTSRTTTAISAVPATRLSRARLPCASTPTPTLARSPSAVRMLAVVRLSLSAAI